MREGVFFERGITNVTMDEVAKNIGISKKTLYDSFPSKEDLLKEVIENFLCHVKNEVSSIIESKSSIQQKMFCLLVTLAKNIEGLNKQFLSDLQRFYPEQWNKIEALRKENISIIRKKILDKEKRFFRRDIPQELFYEVFYCVVQGVLNPKVLSRNSFSTGEALKGVLKILFEGYLTPEAHNWFDNIVENIENIEMEFKG